MPARNRFASIAQPYASDYSYEYNVVDFGAVGDGVTDDTGALQNTINIVAGLGGGVVYLPAGVYVTSACLVVPASYVIVQGAGWNTIIRPVAGATFDVFSTGVIPYGGANAPNNLQGVAIRDLQIDGSNMLANVAGQGNGIHFWGARQSFVDHVLFGHVKNYCVILEGSTTGGYNDVVQYCEMDTSCGGGVMDCNGNEANWILHNEIIGCAQTLAAAQPAFGAQSTAGNCVNHQNGISLTLGNVFGGGASGGTMNQAMILQNEGHRVIGNRFDAVENIAIDIGGSGGNSGHMIAYNEFKDAATVVANPCVRVDAGECAFIGNAFVADSTPHYTWCIQETAALTGNQYIGNLFRVTGTAGRLSLNAASTSRALANVNYNPRGASVTQPAVPASGTPLVNQTGCDCNVYLTGGTFSAAHQIGGVSIGNSTATVLRVAAGQSVTLTYSVAPTWVWIGD